MKFALQGRLVKVSARQRFTCFLFAAWLSCAAMSRAQSASPISTASPVFREVTDETGRTVRVPQAGQPHRFSGAQFD